MLLSTVAAGSLLILLAAAATAAPAEFGWIPAGPAEGTPLQFFASPDSGGSPTWTFPDGSTASGPTASWTPPDVGTYTVSFDGGSGPLTSSVTTTNRVCGATWKVLHQGLGAGLIQSSSFASTTVGWAVGNGGTGLRWDGNGWVEAALPAGDWLDIDMVSTTQAWAVSATGAIARWDGGATWTLVSSPTTNLRAVDFTSASAGWAGGAGLAKYANSVWTSQPIVGLDGNIVALTMLDATQGLFATDAFELFRYGGTTWSEVAAPPFTVPPTSIGMIGTNQVWITAGENVFWQNGGTTWNTATPAIGEDLRSVAVAGPGLVWAAGKDLHRLESGSWKREAVPNHADTIRTMARTSTGALHLFTASELFHGYAGGWKTYSVGRSDIPSVAVTGSGPTLSARLGDATGGLMLLREETSEFEQTLGTGSITGVATASDGSAVAVTTAGYAYAFADGAWTETSRPVTTPLRDVLLTGPGTGWAVGDAGVILRLDAGTWTPALSPTTKDLQHIDAAGNLVMAVGKGGTIVQSTGTGWTTVATSVTSDLYGIDLSSETAGLAVGANRVLKWNGSSWTSIGTPSGTLRDVAYATASEAWMVGDAGSLLRYAGTTLTTETAFTSRNLQSIASSPEGSLVATGAKGLVATRLAAPCTVADFTVPSTVVEGTPATFTANPTIAYPDSLAENKWTSSGFSTVYGDAASFTFPNNGNVGLTLTVKDDDGSLFTSVKTISVQDILPIADAGPDRTAEEGIAFALDGSRSRAGNSYDALTAWQWDLDYTGTFVADLTGVSPSFTFNQQGTYTIAHRVVDEDSPSAVDIVIVTVLDAVPNANAGADRTVTEGAANVLDGRSSTARAADPITKYEWDTDFDGSTFNVDATGSQPTWRPMQQGSYRIALRVTDEDLSFHIDDLILTVLDAVPTAVAPVDFSVYACGNVTVTANASIATDADPILEFRWDLDYNGVSFSGDATGRWTSVPCIVPGQRRVALQVVDEDGSLSLDDLLITVQQSFTGTAPAGGEANPAELVTRTFVLRNLASTSRTVSLQASADANATASVTTSPITIAAGATANVNVQVRISSTAPANSTTHVTLHAQLTACLEIHLNLTIGITIRPVRGIDVRIQGASATEIDLLSDQETAGYVVAIQNLGNLAERVDLSLTSTGGWPASLSTSVVDIAAYGTVTTTLTVNRPDDDTDALQAIVDVLGRTQRTPTMSDTVRATTTYAFSHALKPKWNDVTLALRSAGTSTGSSLAATVSAATGITVTQASRYDSTHEEYQAFLAGGPSFGDFAVLPGHRVRIYLDPTDPDWTGKGGVVTWRQTGAPPLNVLHGFEAGGNDFGWINLRPNTAQSLAVEITAQTNIDVQTVDRWDAAGQRYVTFTNGQPATNFDLAVGQGYRVTLDPTDPDWTGPAYVVYASFAGFASGRIDLPVGNGGTPGGPALEVAIAVSATYRTSTGPKVDLTAPGMLVEVQDLANLVTRSTNALQVCLSGNPSDACRPPTDAPDPTLYHRGLTTFQGGSWLAGQSIQVTVRVNANGTQGTATVSLTEKGLSVSVILIEPVEFVDVSVSPSVQIVNPDGSATYTVTVRNGRVVTDVVALTMSAPPSGWTATLGQTSFTLAPGASATTTLVIDSPEVTQTPYSPTKNPHRANMVLTARAVAKPTLTDTASARLDVPLKAVVGAFVTPRPLLGVLACGAGAASTPDACYPDPTQQVTFKVHVTWHDGTPVAGSNVRVDLTYKLILTKPLDLSNILHPWSTYNAITDANGDATFTVPYDVLQRVAPALPGIANLPGTYSILATATKYDHQGTDTATYIVGPLAGESLNLNV